MSNMYLSLEPVPCMDTWNDKKFRCFLCNFIALFQLGMSAKHVKLPDTVSQAEVSFGIFVLLLNHYLFHSVAI